MCNNVYGKALKFVVYLNNFGVFTEGSFFFKNKKTVAL